MVCNSSNFCEQKSFEQRKDKVHAHLYVISPRKLKRGDIPNEAFHALREMVSNELSSIASPNLVSAVGNDAQSNEHMSENGTVSNKVCLVEWYIDYLKYFKNLAYFHNEKFV
ncbi:hypothetical protein DICVIV_10376 [Dictyocaulus viviparus]|uniref:Uncharacterized protein n=1 Tax=Dictyocaulus viviparus TaxID=29172 RepID=A0A0D8XIK6_DICVI|nr:hypothetical protein DICVIV_10376 [Dictyocaulus viviparus]